MEGELVAVFGPEHGFRGTAQANDSEDFFTDPKTGLPVYDTFEKSGQDLAGIFTQSGADTVLFDVQDVGARFYTYIWTMFDSMEAAALAGKRFVVLDRPNPITGRRATGPVMHPEYATVIGREAISQQHGMTIGELAGARHHAPVPDRRRAVRRPPLGRGADGVRPARVAFREAYFNPTFSTYQGKNCGGVDVLVTEAPAVDAVRVGIVLLVTLKRLYPQEFAWLNTATATEPTWWIDNLTGSDRVRLAVDAGHDVDTSSRAGRPNSRTSTGSGAATPVTEAAVLG
ncbi:DUF1343 domain-containing protein [Flindersiella endophytica]